MATTINWSLVLKGAVAVIAFAIIVGSYLYYGTLNNPVEEVAEQVLEKEIGLDVSVTTPTK